MKTAYVRVVCDITCKCGSEPPRYRVYVNDELFAERTWIWNDAGLEENLQIDAKPDEYTIRYELVPPHLAEINISNLSVDVGDAEIIDNHHFRILA